MAVTSAKDGVEKEPLKGGEQREPKPVRVIVSYPQSEEGVRTGNNKFLKIILGIATVALIIIGSYFLYDYIQKQCASSPNEDRFEILPPPASLIEEHIIRRTLQRYDDILEDRNKTNAHRSLLTEKEQLEKADFSSILASLGHDFAAIQINDENIRRNITNMTLHELEKCIEWIEFYLEEVEYLQSYTRKESSWEVYSITRLKQKNFEKRLMTKLQSLSDFFTPIEEIREPNGSTEALILFQRVLKFSSVVEYLSRHDTGAFQVIILSSVIYMDADYEGNQNLAIISPQWIFLQPVTIHLSGNHGRGSSAQDGLPGEDGQNGGNFLGIGVWDESQLRVRTDGGSGATGHEGKPGKDGVGGEYGKLNNVNYTCVVPIDRGEFNEIEELVTLHKVYHDETCGHTGGPGGLGGRAGIAGQAIFLNNGIEKIKNGFHGFPGKKGPTGKNGTSVPGKCSFTANLVQSFHNGQFLSEKWNRVTKVDCSDNERLPLIKTDLTPVKRKPAKQEFNLRFINTALNAYAWKARERYVRLNESSMFELLRKIEANPMILNFTSVSQIVHEGIDLEDNYKNVDVLQSLLQKVALMYKRADSTDVRQILQYLQANIRSKMSILSYAFGDFYIVDLEKYISLVLENVRKFDKKALIIPNGAIMTRKEESLEKLSKALESINFQTIPYLHALYMEGNDTRLLNTTIMVTESMAYMINILKGVLYNMEEAVQENTDAIKNHIRKYEDAKELHNKLAQLNAAQNSNERNIIKYTMACAELFIPEEKCNYTSSNLIKSNTFKAVDKILLNKLKLVVETNTTDTTAILKTFRTISNLLRKDLSENPSVISAVQDVSDMAEDLALLGQCCQLIRQETTLLDTLAKLNVNFAPVDAENSDAVQKMKDKIVKHQLHSQYRTVFYAYKQWAFPYTVTPVQDDADQDELIAALHRIQLEMERFKITIHNIDEIIREGDFQLRSPIGPFYSWRNEDIRETLRRLFDGQKVHLSAYVHNNPHLTKKHAIRFKRIQILLTGPIEAHLKDYALDLVHSGYSHYIHKDTVYTSIGPEVPLYYSFSTGMSGIPHEYNNAYRKVMGNMSPYTKWTLQLKGITSKARISDLRKFIDTTDIHLVGRGWYIVD